MNYLKQVPFSRGLRMLAALSVFALLLVESNVLAQEAAGNASLARQLRALQSKVAELETTLKQNQPASAIPDRAMMKMGDKMKMNGKMKMGGKMKMDSGKGAMQMGQASGAKEMSRMKDMPMKGKMSGMGGMGMMGGKGMAMMGQMKGMGQMQMPSALPGFAGASHIYHVGSTNFFLDHPQHITLSKEQQTKLNQIKQQSLLGQATSDRWIAEAEQELWLLTSEDIPDAAKIAGKIRETEKLRSDKRIAFIRAVGKAAQVLTAEQRQTLVGMLPPDHKAAGVKDDRK